MADKQEHSRVEIALDGGQVVGCELAQTEWDRFRGWLDDGGSSWVTLTDVDENQHVIPAGKICYIKVVSRQRIAGIGFGDD